MGIEVPQQSSTLSCYFTQTCHRDYRTPQNILSPGEHIPFHVKGSYKCIQIQYTVLATFSVTFSRDKV